MKKLTTIFLILTFVSCNNESGEEQSQVCDNSVFVGRASLTTQQEVNDFGALCYTKIDGVLQIIDTNNSQDKIVDLTPLNNLTEIYTETYPDSLYATFFIKTEQLTSLEGLNNLERVGRLIIRENESLLSLNGLESLVGVDNDNGLTINELRIERNQELINLDGLNNLMSIGTDDNIPRLFIDNNPSLININGLENLNRIGTQMSPEDSAFNGSDVTIIRNHLLQNIDGFSGLNEVYVSISFFSTSDQGGPIVGNDNLADFCGLQNLLTNGVYDDIITYSQNFNGFSVLPQDIIDGNCVE